MTRPNWNGRAVTNAITYVVTRDHGTCHLCDHPGANSCDHITPVTVDPDREWDPTNWAAAHLNGAGTPGGCTTPNCHCPGNRARGNAPADTIRTTVAQLNAADVDEPSREW